ncbi:hypothetical protein QBC40DRAFT_258110 [Triangularia verruculosa]|uniref:Uncharacterized protein n=1 Tax=Triangularia verruculosa TaxID=2587418 RepID=A0AAN6X902_9PEZI|nr:hypothetical protein QBC40DRAFT_258110 [Triangularia verruculosa]
MADNVFDWKAIANILAMNNPFEGQPDPIAFEPTACALVEDLHVERKIRMATLLRDSRKMLTQINEKYWSIVQRENGRLRAGSVLTTKRNFFMFLVDFLQKEIEKSEDPAETLTSKLGNLQVERNLDIVDYDGDWAIIDDVLA